MGRKFKRKAKTCVPTSKVESNISKAQDDCTRKLSTPATISPSNVQSLGIIERLELPPYRPKDSEEDGEDLQLDFRARAYFISSLCSVCLRAEADLACPDCHMVYYCSKEHRQLSAESHRELCGVLGRVGRALGLAENAKAEDYRRLRLQLLNLAQTLLKRPMQLWEREVLLYPRLCRVCHAGRELRCCPECRMEFYCAPKPDGTSHGKGHEDYCGEFRIFRKILMVQKSHGFAAPRIPDFLPDDGWTLPESFDDLIRQVFGKAIEDWRMMDCATYAALSQAASPALTALYALRNLSGVKFNGRNANFKSLTIHVIGAELQFECANLAVWEKLFVHLMPGLRNLKLEFCGPELQIPPEIVKFLERPRLCSKCRAKNREIRVVFHCNKLYHQVRDHEKPDLVCLFNPGLYRTTGFADQDTWPKTIEKFGNYGSPILVTSYTEVELPRDLARIRQFREFELEQAPRRNPFASLRPERNFVSDDVVPLIYKNYFLSIARGMPSGKVVDKQNEVP